MLLMRKANKKIISVCLILIMMLMSFSGCGKKEPEVTLTAIPDIVSIEEDLAKQSLVNNGFLPMVEYIYDDTIEKGRVVKTSPSIGTECEPNTKVTVYVSNGPSYVEAVDANIEWYYITDEEDTWHFNTPYIKENVLYIECVDVVFGTDFKWHEGGLGRASLTDTFDKTVPISIDYEKQNVKAGKKQNFTIAVPLNELDSERPTTVFMEITIWLNGEQEDISVSFSMTW